MLASNYIPDGMTIKLQSENGVLGLVSEQSPNSYSRQLYFINWKPEKPVGYSSEICCTED